MIIRLYNLIKIIQGGFKMGTKNLNAVVDEELHKKLKIKLLKEDITYKDWLTKKIEEYVEGE